MVTYIICDIRVKKKKDFKLSIENVLILNIIVPLRSFLSLTCYLSQNKHVIFLYFKLHSCKNNLFSFPEKNVYEKVRKIVS